MPSTSHHHDVELRFRAVLEEAGLEGPDEVAHLERALVFVWYSPKSLVLIDLDELAEDDELGLAGYFQAA